MKQGFISEYKGIKKQYTFTVKDADKTKYSKKESNHHP